MIGTVLWICESLKNCSVLTVGRAGATYCFGFVVVVLGMKGVVHKMTDLVQVCKSLRI